MNKGDSVVTAYQNFKKSKISRKSKISKTIGRPQNFWKFWISMCFLDFRQKSKKTHGISRNPKNSMCFLYFCWKSKTFQWFFGFLLSKNFHVFFGFLLKIKKHMEIQNFQKFWGRPIVLEILDFVLEILDFFSEILDFHVFLWDFCWK